MKDNLRRLNALFKIFDEKNFQTILITDCSITLWFCNEKEAKRIIMELFDSKFVFNQILKESIIFKRNNIYIYV